MSFEGIQGFLAKYRAFVSQQDADHKKICDVIERISGVLISETELVIVKGELFLGKNSVVKNELFLHKEQILAELHKEGITGIIEIR